jgi:hypothetical protein
MSRVSGTYYSLNAYTHGDVKSRHAVHEFHNLLPLLGILPQEINVH